ncbi:hypothetical protein K470DRAFT_281910 [Piedraia hortae CBS 480.64]|uniref:Uncharacterized protein n=1 Tax=Piedraia hortae CBS 480.64 TaxID=1314780 RepID=A0A6A7C1K8_9PEZI|nr:hypothetical protein K470DRAFT_281910 [Piedraia hortae CBS 480.64]
MAHALDKDVHWFCPRHGAEQDCYFDEDCLNVDETAEQREARHAKLKVVDKRRSDLAADYVEQLKGCLSVQLSRCDVCVREFHRFRSFLQNSLEAEYDDEQVQNFMATISNGLAAMAQDLIDLPPDQRTLAATGNTGMFSLFEALNCGPFLTNDAALQTHFDQPFRLVQTNKKVKLPNYVPAIIAFLTWAERQMERMQRPFAPAEFEHSVKPYFEMAARRLGFLASKLTKNLISTHFRSMDHWQIDSSHFTDMIATYTHLLWLNPTAFWSVAEGIFYSSELVHLKKNLSWVLTFIGTIKPTNLVPPLRAILDHLLVKFQTSISSPEAARMAWHVGLECLRKALDSMRVLGGGPCIAHLMEIVAKDYMQPMIKTLVDIERKTDMQLRDDEQLCLDIIEKSLALDVQHLTSCRNSLIKSKQLEGELGTGSLDIWLLPMRAIKPGHPLLPTAILAGVADLVTLEMFTKRQVEAARKPTEAWNSSLRRILGILQDELFGRLEAFSPEQLHELFQEQKAARGLMALLFNGEQNVHQAALGVFRSFSGEDTRRDVMMYLLRNSFETMLSAVTVVERALSKVGSFSPALIFLKLVTDILGCLCDTEDGVLRAKFITQAQDNKALESFWMATWANIESVFKKTEPWSNLGHDKRMMQDFCRDTMQLADFAFNQYSVIESALEAHKAEGKNAKAGKELLKAPTDAFNCIMSWLRLRDEWLVNKAVGLTCKMLNRLHEVGLEINSSAVKYMADVLTSGTKSVKIKTKLTDGHKAELQRALERHLGHTRAIEAGIVVPEHKPQHVSKKPATVAEWAKSATGTRPSTPQDGLISTMSKGTAGFKALQTSKKQPIVTAQKQAADTSAFLLRRKQDKEAAEKRRLEMLAKSKLSETVGTGLGDLGKDDTRKGDNVMVSSDESSSESEDESDISHHKRLLATKSKAGRGLLLDIGSKPIPIDGPTKIRRTVRSVKDMRARLAPDLQNLHKTILQWDYFHDGDYPPSSNTNLFQPVSNTYTDPTSYRRAFEPLLILEAWQGMVKLREENSSKPYEIKITNRTSVDNYIELGSGISIVEHRELGLSEGDIILLSKGKKPNEDRDAPHSLARIAKIKRQKGNMEVVYQLAPGTPLSPLLTMQATINGLKVQSITPLEREYGALQALQYYDICQQIIKASPSKRFEMKEKQVSACQDAWNVNRAQSEAINAALQNEGFSLIQGPPGSGKTKTIIAIVGGLLTRELDKMDGSGPTPVPISLPGGAKPAAGGETAAKKLLICAPSNAAVDELVMRLKDGVTTRNGKRHQINVVRIGRSEAINSKVQDVTMEELVAKRTGGSDEGRALRAKAAEVFKEHERLSTVLREFYTKRDSGESKGDEMAKLNNEIAAVRRRKNELGVQIDNFKDQERNAGRNEEIERKRAQQMILNEAHVVCATLSGSGHDMFQSVNIEFETVIIDEAAQCVEMSSLIPLKYGCVKCIMVGDPKQLPPTVFSKEAAKFQYEQSLFVRMQNNAPKEVHLLDTQYRMHPDISLFPSRTFYDGLLKDGEGMAELRVRPWHASTLFAPYRFFDVHGQHKAEAKGHSLVNVAEAEAAMAIFNRLTTDFRDFDFTGKVGIITPYKSQLRLLKESFIRRFGKEVVDVVEFNTTDAYQGRESEIIMFSCVRASPAGGIGFLQDIRRMNVGLTRAKSSLWVLGNSESLMRGQYWRKLVEDARARDALITGNIMDMLKKPSSMGTTTAPPDNGVHPESKSPNRSSQSPPREGPKRMTGIQYKFEDRKKRQTEPDNGGQQRPAPHPQPSRDGDVEMTDVQTGPSQRLEKPKPQQRGPSPGTVNGRAANPALKPVSTRVYKRSKPCPLMPPRKPKPSGR